MNRFRRRRVGRVCFDHLTMVILIEAMPPKNMVILVASERLELSKVSLKN